MHRENNDNSGPSFVGSQKIERSSVKVKKDGKIFNKENLNLKLEFKADFDPDIKLSDIRSYLISAIDSYMFQDYKNGFVPKTKEDQISIRELILKPKNEKLTEKFTNSLVSKDFNTKSFHFNLIEPKNIALSDREPLGEGGFGIVYHGKCKAFEVAVKHMKTFHKEKFMKEALVTHYLRSVRSLCIIGLEKIMITPNNNPTVGKTTSLSTGPKYSLEMRGEFVPGKSLKSIVADMTIEKIKEPANELLMILYSLDLAKGIDFLARRKIIHRDLKPDNCMLNHYLDLFIIDFGIAKEQKHDQTNTNETGTMLYYPPENVQDTDEAEKDQLKTQLSGASRKRKISSAFDMWCFGLIISEMFGCEPPWGSKSVNVMTLHARKAKYPIPKAIDNDIIKLLIDNCTKFHPEERINIDNTIKILITLLQERLSVHSENLAITNLFNTHRENHRFVNKVKSMFEGCDQSTIRLDNGYINVGNLLLEQGDIVKAEIYYQKALDYANKNKLNNYVIYNCLGKICEVKLNFVEAKRHYEKSIEINANSDIAYNLLGNLLINLGVYDKSNNYLQLAKQINPQNYKTHINIGRLYEKLRKSKEAEESYQKAKELAPKSSEPLISLGLLCSKQDRNFEALALFKELLKVDRYSEMSYVYYANHLFKMSKDDEQLELLNEYLKKEAIAEYKKKRDEAYRKKQNLKELNLEEEPEEGKDVKELIRENYLEANSVNGRPDEMFECCIMFLIGDYDSDYNAKNEGYNTIINNHKHNLYAYKESIHVKTQLLIKDKNDKESRHYQEIQALKNTLSNIMLIKNPDEDLKNFSIEDNLFKNRSDNFEETEKLLLKAIRLDPEYKDAYIYLTKIYQFQGRKNEEDIITIKYNQKFYSAEEKAYFKNEVSGINYKLINQEKELKEAFSNETNLKKYLDSLNLKTHIFPFDNKRDGMYYNEDDYMENILRNSWKLAMYRGEHVVVKFFNFEDKNGLSEANLFFNFINVFSKINGMNSQIPNLYGVCYREDEVSKDVKTLAFGLVVTYFDGNVSLEQFLKENLAKLTPIEKLRIVIEICSIAEFLHREKIISRCISPEGIIIDPEKHCYLVDFKYSTDKEKNADFIDINSIRYNAPEVFIQKSERIFENSLSDLFYEISTKSDVWSIGAIMLELFSGQIPFIEKSKDDPTILLLAFIDQQEIHLPDSLTKNYKELVPIIKNCLEYNPDKRMTSEQLLIKLKDLKDTMSKK